MFNGINYREIHGVIGNGKKNQTQNNNNVFLCKWSVGSKQLVYFVRTVHAIYLLIV